LPFNNIAELQNVFTEFKRRLLPLRAKPRPILPTADKLPPFPRQHSVPPIHAGFAIPDTQASFIQCLQRPLGLTCGLPSPPIRPADNIEQFSAHPFVGGETSGLTRLNSLLETGGMTTYSDTRNGLVGTEFSTKLSGYLAIGSLTARQMHHRMVLFEDGESAAVSDEDKALVSKYKGGNGFGQGENQGTSMVRFELLWRDYMRLCARKFGNQLFKLDGFSKVSNREWKRPIKRAGNAAEDSVILNRVLSGHTGMGLIDAAQRELFWTGYSSNRARQNVASFIAKDLNIDWRLGAEWFECMLIDYDVASNWGNWQYVAGVGNDPRENRRFNAVKQAHDYDREGDFITTWIPELRPFTYKDNAGRVDVNRLMGLFQAWQIPLAEAEQLGLANLEWVRDPLHKIQYNPHKTPRGNARPNRGGRNNYNRGRGNGNAHRDMPGGRGYGQGQARSNGTSGNWRGGPQGGGSGFRRPGPSQ
jgi:deoxyribodipyrimidine photo-lyase